MKVERRVFLLSIIICGMVTLSPSEGAATQKTASPADIREMFLTIPYPTNIERGATAEKYGLQNEEVFARHFKTESARRVLLAHTDFTKGTSVLDVPGGYIKVGIDEQGSSGEDNVFLLITYFNKADGARLVVLQLGDYNSPDERPITNNFFYMLDGGRYTQQPSAHFLPPLEFFADCWGNQPLPRPQLRKALSGGDAIDIEWPRKGTVAQAVCYTPYIDIDELHAEAAYERRQFDGVALSWDKQHGVFIKGAQIKHRPRR